MRRCRPHASHLVHLDSERSKHRRASGRRCLSIGSRFAHVDDCGGTRQAGDRELADACGMAAASFTTRALALCGAPGADALQLPTDNRSYRSRPVRLRIPLQAEH